MSALDCEFPFSAEIALAAALCRGGDDRDEQGAVADLPPYFRVPGVTPAQLVLIQPDFDAETPEGIGNSTCCGCILTGVAEEDRADWKRFWSGHVKVLNRAKDLFIASKYCASATPWPEYAKCLARFAPGRIRRKTR